MSHRINHKLEHQAAPAFFVRGPSAFARLAFFSVLSIVLMASDSRLHYLTSIRQNLQALLHPLQLLANTPSQIYRNMDEYFTTHDTLLNENRQLKQHELKQDIALQKLNTLALENENLRLLLQTNKSIVESSIVAEIMHVGRDLFTKKIVVNRGSTQGIEAGEAVVDATGVIGQVTRVYPLSSEVTLITDKSLAIPIQVERNGLRAIAFGHGRDNTLDLPYLPTNVDIKRGDKLVTSGIDGVYPAGLAVATVSHIEITPDSPFARIICVPTGGVENHRQVLLVSIPHTGAIPAIEANSEVKTEINAKPLSDKKNALNPTNKKPTSSPTNKKPQTNAKPSVKPQSNKTSKPHASE